MNGLAEKLKAAYSRQGKLTVAVAEEAARRAEPALELEQVNQEIETLLETQKAEERQSLLDSLGALCDAMAADIEKTEGANHIFTDAFATRWKAFCDECVARRAQLGMRGNDVPVHIFVKFWQAKFWLHFMSLVTKPHEIYRNKSFSQIFTEHRPKFCGTERELSEIKTSTSEMTGFDSTNNNGAESASAN